MIDSTGELIIFILYWSVVNIIAQIPPCLIFFVFFWRNRIAIFIVCLAAMGFHAYYWDDINMIIVPALEFIYGPFLVGGICGSMYLCLFALVPIAIVCYIVVCFTFLLFYLPAKFLQILALFLSGGGM